MKLDTNFKADRNNPVWVHVWDDYDEEKLLSKKRLAFEVLKNGKILCIFGGVEEDYLGGEQDFSVTKWTNHEVIEQPKQIPYTVMELHDLGAREVMSDNHQYLVINSFNTISNTICTLAHTFTMERCITNGFKWTSDTKAPYTWHSFIKNE
jgi:hypothetical protein